MSTLEFRNVVRESLNQLITEQRSYLSDRHQDSAEQMRIRQGIVTGLKRAIEVLDETFKNFQ